MLLKLISKELKSLVNRIDTGNTYLSEEEQLEIINLIKKFDKEQYLSKYQAFNYLHISRATFDNLVKDGKLPKGRKQQGFNELSWSKIDLDNYLKSKIK